MKSIYVLSAGLLFITRTQTKSQNAPGVPSMLEAGSHHFRIISHSRYLPTNSKKRWSATIWEILANS